MKYLYVIKKLGCSALKSRQFSVAVDQAESVKRRIFSGIQPTGNIHLGNYFGAIKPWLAMQQEMVSGSSDIEDFRISIVDLHSLTLPQDPQILKENIFKMTASLMACGLDFSRTNVFLQSMVAEHVQLAWILGCMTTMARLSHLPQYKEKMAMVKDGPAGIFLYPVLQAADILLYKANLIPVGEDQLQQIELAQHLVQTFNNRYGYYFPRPKTFLSSEGRAARVMSLRNPEKKMSKSDPDSKNRIELMDSADEITGKIKKAVTDFNSVLSYDREGRPGVSNLIDLWCLFTGDSTEIACENAKQLDTGKFKVKLAEIIVENLRPIRERTELLLADKLYLHNKLEAGAAIAREEASRTWNDVCKLIGLR